MVFFAMDFNGVVLHMYLERWYYSLAFVGISVFAHLGVLIAVNGFRPAVRAKAEEIEVTLSPKRSDSPDSHFHAGKRRAATPKSLQPSAVAVSGPGFDPFAGSSSGSRPRSAGVRTLAVVAANTATIPQFTQAADGYGGNAATIPGGPGGNGNDPHQGTVRTRRMGVSAMETPVRGMVTILADQIGAAAPQNGQTGGVGDANRRDGRTAPLGVPGRVIPPSGGDRNATVRVEAGVGRPLAPSSGPLPGGQEGEETRPKQDSFVAARPKYRTNPLIGYPDAARGERQQGVVMLRIEVSAAGRADSVELETSSGYPMLDERALDIVRRWSFEPARNLSGPVASVLSQPIRFSLNGL